MDIVLTISIGYKRKRPDTHGDKWEARVDSFGLLIVGSIIVLITIIVIVPKILAWIGQFI